MLSCKLLTSHPTPAPLQEVDGHGHKPCGDGYHANGTSEAETTWSEPLLEPPEPRRPKLAFSDKLVQSMYNICTHTTSNVNLFILFYINVLCCVQRLQCRLLHAGSQETKAQSWCSGKNTHTYTHTYSTTHTHTHSTTHTHPFNHTHIHTFFFDSTPFVLVSASVFTPIASIKWK